MHIYFSIFKKKKNKNTTTDQYTEARHKNTILNYYSCHIALTYYPCNTRISTCFHIIYCRLLFIVLPTVTNQKARDRKKISSTRTYRWSGHWVLWLYYYFYYLYIIEKPVYTMRTGLINIPHMSSFRWTPWPWIWSAHIYVHTRDLYLFFSSATNHLLFFFFIWYFLYTTTGINIDPRCPLHAAYCMPSYIYLVCIIYARVFIIIIVYDSLSGPPIILLSISCTAHARNNKLLLYIPQERVKHKSADYNRHSSLHSSYARKIVHDCIMII